MKLIPRKWRAKVIESPFKLHRRHQKRPEWPFIGHMRKRSFPPQLGQAHPYSPPDVVLSLFGLKPTLSTSARIMKTSNYVVAYFSLLSQPVSNLDLSINWQPFATSLQPLLQPIFLRLQKHRLLQPPGCMVMQPVLQSFFIEESNHRATNFATWMQFFTGYTLL